MCTFFMHMIISYELAIYILLIALCPLLDLSSTGFNANTLLKSDWTGLMYACDSGHEAIVKLLLSYGANPNYIKGNFSLDI